MGVPEDDSKQNAHGHKKSYNVYKNQPSKIEPTKASKWGGGAEHSTKLLKKKHLKGVNLLMNLQ